MAKPRGSSTPKRQRTRTKPDAPGAAGMAPPGPGHNGKPVRTDDEVQAGFIQHRTAWNEWKAKRAVVDKIEKDTKAALKADGYLVEEMKVADDLAKNAKSELKVTSSVKLRLRVAKWIGHPMGAQFDLFEQPDRTSSDERAYDQGKRDSMENKPARPPQGISHEPYLSGYHDHQATLAKGFKAPADGGEAAPDKPDPITSGEPVSRSAFNKRLQDMTKQNPDGSPAETH